MSKINTIRIKTSNGQEYPCRVTLGALRRFKLETGREAESLSGASDLALFIWCCCQSASNADGIPFDVTQEEFLDGLDLSAAGEFEALLGGEKKTSK